MKKLAIITTHPIQYNAPVFKLLAERKKIEIKVFYTWENAKEGVFDKKFGQRVKWDIPLLEGYDYQFVKNISKDPGTHHFKGMVNPTLVSEIENWGAKAVLIFGWNFQSHFKAMRYFKGKIPVFFRGDSHLLDEKPGIRTVLRRIWLRFVYTYIDFALYVGTNNKNYFIKHGIKENQLIFTPHSVDNQRFEDNDGQYQLKANEWRLKLGFNEQDLVIIYVGKFDEVKNLLFLIESFKQVKGRGDIKLLFVGKGILESKMISISAENINYLPFHNQTLMPVVYRLGDIVVLPSKSETWGLTVNEAMACGKPVLVSDKVGCAVDLVKNNVNGKIFKSGDSGDLINILKVLDKSELKQMGINSQKLIAEHNFTKFALAVESAIN
ncbi:MAG: glycosyltransferase family 4 protein [Bacteroidales bacterium]